MRTTAIAGAPPVVAGPPSVKRNLLRDSGIVMVRDDNGGICDCDRCKAYVAASRTISG